MGDIRVVECLRCGNALLMREINEKRMHCEPCRKLIEDAKHKEQQSIDLDRANKRGRM